MLPTDQEIIDAVNQFWEELDNPVGFNAAPHPQWNPKLVPKYPALVVLDRMEDLVDEGILVYGDYPNVPKVV